MSAKKNKNTQKPTNNKPPVSNTNTPNAPIKTTQETKKSVKEPKVIDEQTAGNILEFKKETLLWIFSIFGALFIYYIIANFIQNSYHPDIKALIAKAYSIGIPGSDARPEPVESLLFHLGILVVPLCLLLFYFALSKVTGIAKLAATPFFLVVTAVSICFFAAMVYYDFAATNPFSQGTGEIPQNARDLVGSTNFDFYFDGNFLGTNLMVYTFIIVPAIACLFFFGFRKLKWDDNKLFKIISSVTGYILAGLIVIAVIGMNSFKFPYTYENKFDFNAVYYSMTQVFAGSPLLVNGFTNTYGLYPHFMNIILHFTGLNVENFSTILACLLGLSFVFNFIVLKQFVNNQVIVILGFFSVMFFPYLNARILINFDCNFAFFPIRYLVPSALAFLTGIYLLKNYKILYWAIFIKMAAFILWNPEFGMVSYLSWITINIYKDFYDGNGKVNIKKILFHIVVSVVMVVAVFMIYKFLIHAFYGASPDFALLFATIQKYGSLGLGCLPMVLIHPWNIVIMIYVLGLTYAIVQFCKKDITPKATMILLTSLIGVGLFAYFQGRSHNWCLSSSSGFSMLVLALLGDELWTNLKTKNILALNALFVVFLFLISFSLIETLFNYSKINDLVYQEDEKNSQQQEQNRIESNIQYILKNSHEKEKIFILPAVPYEGLYFDGHKRMAAFHPGLIDLFQNADLTKMERVIEDSSFNIFIEPALCNLPYLNGPFAAVGAAYEYADSNLAMFLLHKRKTKVPAATYFKDDGSALFHRKYTDDTAGLNARVNDALGTKAIALNPEFSVQVLFSPKTQIYNFATLVGNMDDSSGFMIGNIKNTSNYFFGFNGKGSAAPMVNSDWVYCVMNVYHDHIEIYENGALSGTFGIPAPIKQSHEKLYIGNLGYFRYYLGAISEVAVNNKPLDKEQMAATWEEIKKDVLKQ